MATAGSPSAWPSAPPGCSPSDTAAEDVAKAMESLPAVLAERVEYRVASVAEIEIERSAFDIVLFSWSL